MKGIVSILPVLPVVALPNALALPYLLGAAVSPNHPIWIAIAFRLYYASLLCIWLLTVGLTLRKTRKLQTSQFSLKGLLGLVAISAIGLAAVFNGSVFSFVVLWLFTVGVAAWCLYATYWFPHADRTFCFAFGVLACVGALWSLTAPGPITQTPLFRSMWWGLAGRGNGMAWYMASFLGSQYLLLTCLAAYSGAWLASILVSARQGPNRRRTRRT